MSDLSVRGLHDAATDLAMRAMIERDSGNTEKSDELYSRALAFEEIAALKVDKMVKPEPTRSILFRSSASLAYQAGRISDSIRLIEKALDGSPSKRVLSEIDQLYLLIRDGLYSEETGKPI